MSNHSVFIGPESEHGFYFYSEPVGYGSVKYLREGEFPVSLVEVEQISSGIDTMIAPPAVPVESQDPQEAIQKGVNLIVDNFDSFLAHHL